MKMKDVELELMRVRMENQRKAHEEEANRSRQLTNQVSTFSQTETELRSQLNIYVEKFKQVGRDSSFTPLERQAAAGQAAQGEYLIRHILDLETVIAISRLTISTLFHIFVTAAQLGVELSVSDQLDNEIWPHIRIRRDSRLDNVEKRDVVAQGPLDPSRGGPQDFQTQGSAPETH